MTAHPVRVRVTLLPSQNVEVRLSRVTDIAGTKRKGLETSIYILDPIEAATLATQVRAAVTTVLAMRGEVAESV